MRVHAAFWEYVKQGGHRQAVAYASTRTGDPHEGTKWLRGRAGKTLRRMWSEISDDRREQLMIAHPDPSFPVGTAEIVDERTSCLRQHTNATSTQTCPPSTTTEPSVTVTNTTEPTTASNTMPQALSHLAEARESYWKVIELAELNNTLKAARDGDAFKAVRHSTKYWTAVSWRMMTSKVQSTDHIASLLDSAIFGLNSALSGSVLMTDDEVRNTIQDLEKAVEFRQRNYAQACATAAPVCDRLGLSDPYEGLSTTVFQLPASLRARRNTPSTTAPSTPRPSTTTLSTVAPSTTAPSSPEPSTAAPSTPGPKTAAPSAHALTPGAQPHRYYRQREAAKACREKIHEALHPREVASKKSAQKSKEQDVRAIKRKRQPNKMRSPRKKHKKDSPPPPYARAT